LGKGVNKKPDLGVKPKPKEKLSLLKPWDQRINWRKWKPETTVCKNPGKRTQKEETLFAFWPTCWW